jgi:microsomal dipeptidase-like Zn-dependent dipeptidase
MKGGVNVAVVSLYPIEKGFVLPTLLPSLSRYTVNWISMFGRKRVDDIKSKDFSYFKDLIQEYEFLKSLNKIVPVNGKSQYNIVKNGADLVNALPNEALNIIVSIEGAHVFCDGNDVTKSDGWSNVEANVKAVKGWEFPPFFITLNHHFYNGLASHAQSLFVRVLGKDLFDQVNGMEKPIENGKFISALGLKVIDLLYQTDNGKRILVDIKHMAKGTRQEFYAYRRSKQYDNIPIISSHGAVDSFYNHPINLSKDDLTEIYNSNGIFGIELDQRVLGYNDGERGKRFSNWFKNAFKGDKTTDVIWSEYFWKNIQVVAEHCYSLNPNDNPWKMICLGSDLDGIINPLNKFRTAADFQNLANALLKDIQAYWDSGRSIIPAKHLGMDAHDVVYQIMYANALNFIKANY